MPSKAFVAFFILTGSLIAAAITGPPHPAQWYGIAAAMFVLSFSCYVVGRRHGRKGSESSIDPKLTQRRGRFQFGLGALLGSVTLVLCIVAGIAWDQSEWKQFKYLFQMMDDAANSVAGLHAWQTSGSTEGGGDKRISHSNYCWEMPPGSRIPEGFLGETTGRTLERLRQHGANAWSEPLETTSCSSSNKICSSSNKIDYVIGNGSIRGTIILRLIHWDGPNPGGVFFLDQTLYR